MNNVNLNTNSCNDVSLGWISQEINLCLVQARQYLEAFQDYGDADDLEESRNQIHQLRNTLIVINLYGASMLADEIEDVFATAPSLDLREWWQRFIEVVRGELTDGDTAALARRH